MKKSLILLSILLVTLIVVVGCNSDSTELTEAMTTEDMSSEEISSEEMSSEELSSEEASTEAMSEELPVFTLEELAKFDGQNGSAVYVGYEGKVYDVSNVEEWKTGTHRGRIKAGQDLTDVLNNEAPHSSQRLMDNAPVVGVLE